MTKSSKSITDQLIGEEISPVSVRAPADRGEILRTAVVCAVLFVGTFALFSPALNHGFLGYDDPNYVTQNIHVQTGLTWENVRWAFTTGHAANWHPLTWLTHMLDWKLYGDNPRGHHATNILLHSLNAVLAFLAIRRLTGSFWPSAVAAALFAWHPLRVESVVWISERKDVLSGFFGLATIWSYAAYAQAHRAGKSVLLYVLTLVTLALGLLSKPMLVTLPCVLLLLDFWPLRRVTNPASFLRCVLEKIPFFVMSLASSIVTYRVQRAGGAVIESFGLASRLVNCVVSVALYLEKFFWPFGLAVGYPYPAHWPAATVALSMTVVGAISLIALLQWRRRSWILVGWLWCLGMWVPVIGLVKVGLQGMADRYTYLPMIGIELALIWTLAPLFRKAPKPAAVFISLILLGCAARTWNQISIWGDQHVLYRHALEVTSDNYLAECYLGSILVNDGQLDQARDLFVRALEIKPDYADARLKLGLVLERTGHLDEAAAEYRRVLADRPKDGQANYHLGELLVSEHQAAQAIPYLDLALRADPEFPNTWISKGVADSDLHRYQEALDCFQHALIFKPGDDEAHFDEANALSSLNRLPEVLAEYDRAIALNPAMATAHSNKGDVLRKMGHPADAIAEYRQAIDINPKDADTFFGLGSAFDDLGHPAQAARCYARAVMIRPAFPDAQYNLGVILFNNNQPAAAVDHFIAAIRAENDDEPAYVALGLAQNQLGRTQQAIAALQQAITLNPNDADAHDYLGTVFDGAGQHAAAIDQWHQVQRINPNYPGLADQLRPTPATNPQTNPSGG